MNDLIKDIYTIQPEHYGVNSKFDIDKHIKQFVNYCEVVIDIEGNIYYATPSHDVFLYTFAAVQYGLLDSEYLKPDKSYKRIITGVEEIVSEYLQKEFNTEIAWMWEKVMEDTGLVLLHYNNIQYVNELSDSQIEVLYNLRAKGAIERSLKWQR